METIGAQIDDLFKLKQHKKQLEADISILQKEIDGAESALLERMDREATTKGAGGSASANVSESVKPNVADWDTFYNYIYRTKQFQLLERRPSVTGCRELFENKGVIPGVVPYVKRVITIRSL